MCHRDPSNAHAWATAAAGAALWREESKDTPGLDALLELGGAGSRLTGGLLAASLVRETLVRVGRASAAPRTRLGPEE